MRNMSPSPRNAAAPLGPRRVVSAGYLMKSHVHEHGFHFGFFLFQKGDEFIVRNDSCWPIRIVHALFPLGGFLHVTEFHGIGLPDFLGHARRTEKASPVRERGVKPSSTAVGTSLDYPAAWAEVTHRTRIFPASFWPMTSEAPVDSAAMCLLDRQHGHGIPPPFGGRDVVPVLPGHAAPFQHHGRRKVVHGTRRGTAGDGDLSWVLLDGVRQVLEGLYGESGRTAMA